MWIYKISNNINDKVYIGQSIKPIQKRFKRHIDDAINNKLNTHFARAIRKYGSQHFFIQIIDSANTQQQLNQKQRQWIIKYDSVNNGYNQTDAIYKCGGNTYMSKTQQQLAAIRYKLSESKLGNKNPMSRMIKRINILTNDEDIFPTIISCAKACGIKNGKTSIVNRLNGKIIKPFNKIWIFEYCNE